MFCQAAGQREVADGFRHQGHSKTCACPEETGSGIVVAAENIRFHADILEGRGDNRFKAAVVDERLSRQVRQFYGTVGSKGRKVWGFPHCHERFPGAVAALKSFAVKGSPQNGAFDESVFQMFQQFVGVSLRQLKSYVGIVFAEIL